MPPHNELAGKTVLLTGASRGLGEAIARRLWSAGASLALLARDAAALDVVAAGLPAVAPTPAATAAAGAPAQTVATFPCDLADVAAVEAAHAAAVDRLGDVDVLVNNAAVQGPLGPLEAVDFAAWRAVFDVDLFAAVRLCQLVVPAMRRKGRGKIVNLSGGGATSPRPDVTAYACAKTALVRLGETLAEELKGTGIDVNAVAPGAMNTRMLEETLAAGPAGVRGEYAKAVERKEKGGTPPEAAAELVAFLCSPAGDGVTGRLVSAVWDDWRSLPGRRDELAKGDVYTLRRIVPGDRGLTW